MSSIVFISTPIGEEEMQSTHSQTEKKERKMARIDLNALQKCQRPQFDEDAPGRKPRKGSVFVCVLVCLFGMWFPQTYTMHTQIIQFKLWILFRYWMCWFAIRMPRLQASGGVKWKLLCTQHFYPLASQIVIHNRQRHRRLITMDAYKSMEDFRHIEKTSTKLSTNVLLLNHRIWIT